MKSQKKSQKKSKSKWVWIVLSCLPPTITDEPFWLMLMEKNIHVVDNSFTYSYGNE